MNASQREAIARRALPLVDLTDLGENSSHASVDELCSRAATEFGPVGAICIWPRFVAHAHKALRGTGIPIATVVNFPGGNQSVDMTVVETQSAVADGAAEIDLVIPYQSLAGGDEQAVLDMVSAVREATGPGILLKVIIESGELKTPELIHRASELAIQAGADFIKTSTGKVAVNATPETAEIMLQVIADTTERGGRTIGFKPAGGIKTTQDAGIYLAIADRLLGADWASSETLRFGASSVLDDLLAALRGEESVQGEGY